MLKSEQERLEADKRELEIVAELTAANNAAQVEFSKATKEEWERYERIWTPARERWAAFIRPYFEALAAKMVANQKAGDEAFAKVRGNWKECPHCGAKAGRYQVFCSVDKCGTNLLTGGPTLSSAGQSKKQ